MRRREPGETLLFLRAATSELRNSLGWIDCARDRARLNQLRPARFDIERADRHLATAQRFLQIARER